MIDRELVRECFAASSTQISPPDNFIIEVPFLPNLVERCLNIMAFLLIEMHRCCHRRPEFAKKNEPFTKKLNKLRAKDFVTVSFFLVLHEILPVGKRRIDVDEFYVTSAEAIRPFLVSQQFPRAQKVIAQHEKIVPAIRMGALPVQNCRTSCHGAAGVRASTSSRPILPS